MDHSKKDPLEEKYEEDLKKALALSLESHALEQYKHGKNPTGKNENYFISSSSLLSGTD